jgi:hypothetical protein
VFDCEVYIALATVKEGLSLTIIGRPRTYSGQLRSVQIPTVKGVDTPDIFPSAFPGGGLEALLSEEDFERIVHRLNATIIRYNFSSHCVYGCMITCCLGGLGCCCFGVSLVLARNMVERELVAINKEAEDDDLDCVFSLSPGWSVEDAILRVEFRRPLLDSDEHNDTTGDEPENGQHNQSFPSPRTARQQLFAGYDADAPPRHPRSGNNDGSGHGDQQSAMAVAMAVHR